MGMDAKIGSGITISRFWFEGSLPDGTAVRSAIGGAALASDRYEVRQS